MDKRPNVGYKSEKLKSLIPQADFEPTPLEELIFIVKRSTYWATEASNKT